MIDMLMASIGL